jgi:hypothetical protein
MLERLDVELAVLAAELHQVEEARLHAESSIDMYSEHGFDALIRPVFGQRVPRVDRRVVLDARVGALPRRLGDLPQQAARVDVSTTVPSVRAVRFHSAPPRPPP